MQRPALPEPEHDRDHEALEARPGPTPLDLAGFALAAVRRRLPWAALVFVTTLAASIAYYLHKTPVYRVEAKILAQRSQALPTAVRAMPDDVPGRSAWEMIHRHDNLVALVEQTKLLADPAPRPESRLPALVQRVLGRRNGEHDHPKDPVEDVVVRLDKSLLVRTDEGTISIELDWPDPQKAYLVVEAALHNFLEARHLQEITAIDEVISVFQGRAATLRTQLEEATERARTHAPARTPPPARRPRLPSEELVRLQAMLEAKGRALRDVEEFRLRRLADLQTQLDQARNTLSDAHPTVIGLRKDIEALSRETPQAAALREEQAKLSKEYSERLAREGLSAFPSPIQATHLPAPEPSPQEDPRVRDLRLQFEQITQRISAAQVDLDAARAAFKYRYHVIWPPQVPREPVSPDARKIIGLGFIAAVLLTILACAAPDLLSGRVLMRWQVERVLGLRILGELDERR